MIIFDHALIQATEEFVDKLGKTLVVLHEDVTKENAHAALYTLNEEYSKLMVKYEELAEKKEENVRTDPTDQ